MELDSIWSLKRNNIAMGNINILPGGALPYNIPRSSVSRSAPVNWCPLGGRTTRGWVMFGDQVGDFLVFCFVFCRSGLQDWKHAPAMLNIDFVLKH